MAPLPLPLDQHCSDVAGFVGGSVSISLSRQPCWPVLSPTAFPQQLGPTFTSPLAPLPLGAWTPYGLPPQQVGPTFVPPLVPRPPTVWTPYDHPSQQVGPTFTPPLAPLPLAA
jgi:hypothetical protein